MIFDLTDKMREDSTSELGLKMVNTLPFIYQPDREAQEKSDTSAADLQYQTHVTNYLNFTRGQLRLFSVKSS